MRRIRLLTLQVGLLVTVAGCELVADFDRDKLPMKKNDAGVAPIRDGGVDKRDAAKKNDDDDASTR